MQRVLQLFRPGPCFRRVQQAGLYNLLVPLLIPFFKNASILVEAHFCPHY